MSILDKFIGAMKWSTFGNVATVFIQLLQFIILSRLLPPEEFGVAAVVMLVVGLSDVLIHAGVGPAVVKMSETRELFGTARVLALVFGCAAAFLIWGTSAQVSNLFAEPALDRLLELTSLIFIVQGISIVEEAKFQKIMKFKNIILANMLGVFFGSFVTTIFLAHIGWGATAIISGVVTKVTIKTVFLMAVSEEKNYRFCLLTAIEIVKYSFGFSLGRFFNYIAFQSGAVVISKTRSIADLGYYSRAFYLVELATGFIGKTIDKSLFPAFSSVNEEPARLKSMYLKAIQASLVLFMPISVFGFFYSKEIVDILFGPNWASSIIPLKVLLLGLVVRAGSRINDCLVRSTGAVYSRALIQAVYAVMALALCFLGSTKGIVEICVAINIAILFNYILMLKLSCRLLSITSIEIVNIHAPSFSLGFLLCVFLSLLKHSVELNNSYISIFVGMVFIVVFTALSLFFLLVHFGGNTGVRNSELYSSSIKYMLKGGVDFARKK